MVQTHVFVKIKSSAAFITESVIEFNVVPNEKTPWHYHDVFSETFEVLRGTLEVGKDKKIYQLKQGDIVTIQPQEKHYFNNAFDEECVVKVTVRPGNKNFEKALLISKGLTKDGFANLSGIPTKISDLALILYLYNSRMVGFRKLVEPLFKYLARRSINKGRLDELTRIYCDV
jgi:mannose-6-phosphate isomerase-like protein (cupin superfamily)